MNKSVKFSVPTLTLTICNYLIIRQIWCLWQFVPLHFWWVEQDFRRDLDPRALVTRQGMEKCMICHSATFSEESYSIQTTSC